MQTSVGPQSASDEQGALGQSLRMLIQALPAPAPLALWKHKHSPPSVPPLAQGWAPSQAGLVPQAGMSRLGEAVAVAVAMTVMVEVGVATVIVVLVAPAHKQALE